MYAAAVLAAASAAYVAAAQSPEPRDNPTIADVMSISVFMAVFFPVFVVLLAFACLRLFRAPDDDPQTPDAASAPEWPRGARSSRKGGLDAAAIAALPLVFFREVRQHRIVDEREDDVLECSVCLLEFDDDDALRLLPTCPHSFHPECIGLWLERHSTCPLCRASVLDTPTAPAAQLQTAPPPPPPLITPDSSPVPSAVVLIGNASASAEGEEEDWTRIQLLARNRRAAGRQALPRSNSTGHSASDDGGMEPTSSVASVRGRERQERHGEAAVALCAGRRVEGRWRRQVRQGRRHCWGVISPPPRELVQRSSGRREEKRLIGKRQGENPW